MDSVKALTNLRINAYCAGATSVVKAADEARAHLQGATT